MELFYYLRVIATMLALPSEAPPEVTEAIPQAGGVALAALTALLFWLGV